LKDEPLLNQDKSENRTDSINERILRIRREIYKGPTTYTMEELAKLQRMLDDYEHLLDALRGG
jgi:hypothetical protein